jgi:hypothetical protein
MSYMSGPSWAIIKIIRLITKISVQNMTLLVPFEKTEFVPYKLFLATKYCKVKKGKGHPIQATKGLEGGRGIALLFHDLGARRGWVVSTKPRPLYPRKKTRYPMYRRLAGWAPGPVWTCAKNLAPQGFDPRTVQPVVSRYTD